MVWGAADSVCALALVFGCSLASTHPLRSHGGHKVLGGPVQPGTALLFICRINSFCLRISLPHPPCSQPPNRTGFNFPSPRESVQRFFGGGVCVPVRVSEETTNFRKFPALVVPLRL